MIILEIVVRGRVTPLIKAIKHPRKAEVKEDRIETNLGQIVI
jgi:hypothetical protein